MRKKRIVIVGAGGMAREIASTIRSLNQVRSEYAFLGYVVTDLNKLCDRDSRDQVLGNLDWLSAKHKLIDAVAMGIGTPQARISVAEQVAEILPEVPWPSLIHPSAEFERESAKISYGVFVGAGFVGTVNLNLESLALCNFGCTVGHESVIGRGSVVNPGANISGGVNIGREVQIGSGAQVLQYLTVGDAASVGAGAVVTKNVPPGVTVVGIPARPLEVQTRKPKKK